MFPSYLVTTSQSICPAERTQGGTRRQPAMLCSAASRQCGAGRAGIDGAGQHYCGAGGGGGGADSALR